MQEKVVVGVDSSTTSCKVIAWNRAGQALAEASSSHSTHNPRRGWYEQDAETWWTSFCRAARELAEKIEPSRIESLCITNQRETIVPVDSVGSPLRRAILWMDGRARKQLEEIDRIVGRDRLHRLTGKPLSTLPSLPKLLWIAETEPDLFSKASSFVEPHAFLVHRLTGEMRTSLACADPVGLVDMQTRAWATEVAEELGIRVQSLPDVVESGEVIGTVSRSAAAETGLPEGLPIIAGAGDGQCGGLGAGVVGHESAYLCLGTGVISGYYCPEYIVDKAFRTLYSPVSDGYYLETVINGGVYTVSWFVQNFAPDLGKEWLSSSAEQMLEEGASTVPAGSGGLLLVPYWLGAMNPFWDPDATGIMIGWNGSHGIPHFYRAILEGIAFEQRLATEGVVLAGVRDFAEFRILGGGSRSDLWCQIIANITRRPVLTLRTSEASALGAGMIAAVAAGWYPDCGSAAEAMTATETRYDPADTDSAVYDRIFKDVYSSLFKTVRPLANRLRRIAQESE